MEIDSGSVGIGIWIGVSLCPLLLSLGADDKKERRERLGEETFYAILLGGVAGFLALLVVNVWQGHGVV